MVALADQSSSSSHGIRPFNVARDIGPVTDVIAVAFADELGPGERSILQEFRLLQYGAPLLWLAARLTPDFDAMFGGFVWIEDNRIVGTLTLTRLGVNSTHWLISNVAVLPAYRHRGIARGLMAAALETARGRGGRVITLQVRHTNTAAYRLYDGLGFQLLEQTATLERPVTTTTTLEATMLPIRPWDAADSHIVLDLAQSVVPASYQALLPLHRGDFRPDDVDGWFGDILDWVRGYKMYRLAIPDGDEFAAMLTLRARLRGGHHQLEMNVRPRWRGRLEPTLVMYALRILTSHGRRPMIAEIRTTETAAIETLQSVGFTHTFTLDRLGLSLVKT